MSQSLGALRVAPVHISAASTLRKCQGPQELCVRTEARPNRHFSLQIKSHLSPTSVPQTDGGDESEPDGSLQKQLAQNCRQLTESLNSCLTRWSHPEVEGGHVVKAAA